MKATKTTERSPVLTHVATQALAAPPERAFQALIDPAALARWFAAHVIVEPREGGAYRFFGAATLGAPAEADADQRLVAFVPGERLSFSWKVLGVASLVTYTVSAGKEGESALEVRHAIHGELPIVSARDVIDDLWRIHLSNLAEHLRGGSNVVLPDFTTARPEVIASIEIDAPRAKVFRALSEPELMNQWLGGAAQVDLANDVYVYGWSYDYEDRKVAGGPTKILERKGDELLVTDWTDWRGDPTKPATRVTWKLESLPPDGKRTRVTVIHDGFAHPVDRSDYQQGWGHFLDGLAKVAGAGETRGSDGA